MIAIQHGILSIGISMAESLIAVSPRIHAFPLHLVSVSSKSLSENTLKVWAPSVQMVSVESWKRQFFQLLIV